MATANEHLIKHLNLALRELKELCTRDIDVIEDEVFEIVDKISGLLLELTTTGSQIRLGFMKTRL